MEKRGHLSKMCLKIGKREGKCKTGEHNKELTCLTYSMHERNVLRISFA